MVSKKSVLAKAARDRLLPKFSLKQVAGDAIFLSIARRAPNFMSMAGLGRYQAAADLVVAGVGKGIVTGGGKSLSRAGIASAASNVVEDIFPLISRLAGGLGSGAAVAAPGSQQGQVVTGRVVQD